MLVGHEGAVACCCVSEDGKTVVSGGRDSLVIVWDAETGQSKMQYNAKASVAAVKVKYILQFYKCISVDVRCEYRHIRQMMFLI